MPKILILTAFLASMASAGHTQSLDVIGQTRDGFQMCVMQSAVAQARPGLDPNTLSEAAFQACFTEEQALRMALNLQTNDRAFIDAGILRVKLDLKNEIRRSYERSQRRQ